MCLSSAFWDGTKKPSLGRHRSAFVGKNLRAHSESDHLVARCGLSRPRTPFQVRSFLSRPLCLPRRFGTEPGNRVWGIAVRLLWARNFEITQNRTTQWLDVNFRGRSKSGRSFLGHCAFLWRFGTEPGNRVWGIVVRLLWARNFEITQNRTTMWLEDFRGLGPRSKSDRPFPGHWAFLRRFGTERGNRVWGVTVPLLWARNFEIRTPSC